MVSVYNLSKTKQNIMMKHNSSHEIEFKWQAHSKTDYEHFRRHAKALGAGAYHLQTLHIRDLYLDTAGGEFATAGLKCRLRHSGDKWQVTLKSFGRRKKGMAERMEREIKLPSFKSRIAALRYVTGRLEGVLLDGPLLALFEVRNLRSLCRYKLPGHAKAEACFDRVTISRGRKKIKMKEIEFEFLNGDLAAFKQFTGALTLTSGLKPQKKSKIATAAAFFTFKKSARKKRISGRNFTNFTNRLAAALR